MTDFFYLQNMSWDREAFKSKVENEHDFPGEYVFKFIIPAYKKDDVTSLLPKGELSFRSSSGSKYLSITLRARLNSAEEVVTVYEKTHSIEGIVAL